MKFDVRAVRQPRSKVLTKAGKSRALRHLLQLQIGLIQKTHTFEITRFYQNEKLPDNVDGFDFLVVMGGPQSPETNIEAYQLIITLLTDTSSFVDRK